jgi:isocitrate dehydrogenase kinase/phosphatase
MNIFLKNKTGFYLIENLESVVNIVHKLILANILKYFLLLKSFIIIIIIYDN